MITRNYARSPNGVPKLADNRRQTTVCRQKIGHGLQAVQRLQLIKINFNPCFYLVTGDKADNQNILFLRLFNQIKG